MVSLAGTSQFVSKSQPLESEMFASCFHSGTFTVTATPWGWYHKIVSSLCLWLSFLSWVLTFRRHEEYKADAGSIRSKVHLWLFLNYFNEPDSANKHLELQEVGGMTRRKDVQWEHLLRVSLHYYHGLHELHAHEEGSCLDPRFCVKNLNSLGPILPTW